MKIDIHTHILPETWPDLKARYGYGGFVQLEHHGPGCARMSIDGRAFRDVDKNCWDPATRLAECDGHGVDVQVLSTVPIMFSYWAEPKDAHDLSRLLNDHIAGVVGEQPRRFVGLGTVPMQDPDLAVQELERCVTVLGLAGIQVGTHVNGKNLDDERVFPVLEAAEALGAAVFVHPWDMLAKDRMSRYWLSWLVGMPAETALAICSMLFGGVFDRLPRLRVAFAHGGGAFPGTVGRIEHGFQVRPDLCAIETKTSPRDQLGRFYVDALVHDAAALRHLIDLVGAGRVALGTDYPFPLGELAPGALIDSLGLEASIRERLLAGSALEWLNLEPERFA
ncbi:MAG: amidohydrolase family protein [Dehalococcoidia bacterium]|nr:amidohydrolase family protein [Dehalococcoidia bacterium]